MIQKYKGLLNEEFMIRSFSEDTNDLIISASEDGSVYVWSRFNKENNKKKNYYYESFKPFQKDVCTCSIFGSDVSNTNYLKKLFNLTTKIMVHSIIINSTVGGRIQVLLNCEEI
jgi:WD40 repeat protein